MLVTAGSISQAKENNRNHCTEMKTYVRRLQLHSLLNELFPSLIFNYSIHEESRVTHKISSILTTPQ